MILQKLIGFGSLSPPPYPGHTTASRLMLDTTTQDSKDTNRHQQYQQYFTAPKTRLVAEPHGAVALNVISRQLEGAARIRPHCDPYISALQPLAHNVNL